MDKHKINELTDSIVDDLIKNAFKPEPVQIEEDKKEGAQEDDSACLQNEYLEMGEEEDNLNLRDSFKNQELSKEEAKEIKSPVKRRPGDKISDDGQEQS
tara:strand:+ start:68 stop:364 length:297 start_codon:yes stop_codon:yes gene_type:complete